MGRSPIYFFQLEPESPAGKNGIIIGSIKIFTDESTIEARVGVFSHETLPWNSLSGYLTTQAEISAIIETVKHIEANFKDKVIFIFSDSQAAKK